MSTPIDLRAKVDDYLAERRRLGFELRNMALALVSFASYAKHVGHQGSLTTDVMADWARQDKAQNQTMGTWARRLKVLRPFTRWLRQFEPRTEVPDASVFGSVPGRMAPHIYHEAEIV
jgi:site-specific recombinase XerD